MSQSYKEQVEAIHAGLMTTDMNGSPSELYIARWQAEDIAATADAALAAAREERDALRAENVRALDLLEALFDGYENGTPSFDGKGGAFLGNAFRVDDDTFKSCVELLNAKRPRSALAAIAGRAREG